MFAIIETGGKQYQVSEGRYVDIELLGAQKDEKVTFICVGSYGFAALHGNDACAARCGRGR